MILNLISSQTNIWILSGLLLILFFAFMRSYFWLARVYGWVDVPNHRSSHSRSTIVGAGLVFYVAVFAYYIISDYQTPYLLFGATLIAIVGFLDDRISVHSGIRVAVQLLATVLMMTEIGFANELYWYYWILVAILVVGTLNAYNFMDGINGITGLYSLVFMSTILMLPDMKDYYLLAQIEILAILVFLVYNLRTKAVCFSGDVGSVTIAFVILTMLLYLMIKTDRWDAILLLAVYGVDSVMTIIYRISRKENIFQAHRSHIYQLLVHNRKMSHITVSFIYAILQLVINLIFIGMTNLPTEAKFAVVLVILSLLGVATIPLRRYLIANSLHS